MNIVEPNCLTARKSLKRLMGGDPYGEPTFMAYQGDGRDEPRQKWSFRKIEHLAGCLTFSLARIDARRVKTGTGLVRSDESRISPKLYGPTSSITPDRMEITMELRELLLNPTKEMLDAGQTALDDCVDHDWDSGGDGEGYNSYTTIRTDAASIVFKAMVAVAIRQPA